MTRSISLEFPKLLVISPAISKEYKSIRHCILGPYRLFNTDLVKKSDCKIKLGRQSIRLNQINDLTVGSIWDDTNIGVTVSK